MTKFLLPILILLFSSCGTIDRKDFIKTVLVAHLRHEIIIYSVYQIDVDDYIVKFKSVVDKDTSDIFEYNITDAVYSENSFDFMVSRDTLIIASPQQTSKFHYKTKKGTTIQLRPKYMNTWPL